MNRVRCSVCMGKPLACGRCEATRIRLDKEQITDIDKLQSEVARLTRRLEHEAWRRELDRSRIRELEAQNEALYSRLERLALAAQEMASVLWRVV